LILQDLSFILTLSPDTIPVMLSLIYQPNSKTPQISLQKSVYSALLFDRMPITI
jgi:hypothetical protein